MKTPVRFPKYKKTAKAVISACLLCFITASGALLPGAAGKPEPSIPTVNAGVVFSGKPSKIALPVSSENLGSGAVIARIDSSCDCLVHQGRLPRELPADESQHLEFQYTPAGAGAWNVGLALEIISNRGMETQKIILYGTAAESDWLASAPDALAAVRAGRAQIVDLRESAHWQAVHATGALNMRLGELTRQAALKKRTLIIYDGGISDDRAFEAVSHLRQKGFAQACVLSGGLVGWAEAGGPLEGHDTKKVHALAPAEAGSAPLTVSISPVDLEALPGAMSPVSELLAFASANPADYYILAAADDRKAQAAIAQAPESIRKRLRYVSGGGQALALQDDAARGAGAGQQPVTVYSGKRSVLARAGSCGGCGRK